MNSNKKFQEISEAYDSITNPKSSYSPGAGAGAGFGGQPKSSYSPGAGGGGFGGQQYPGSNFNRQGGTYRQMSPEEQNKIFESMFGGSFQHIFEGMVGGRQGGPTGFGGGNPFGGMDPNQGAAGER